MGNKFYRWLFYVAGLLLLALGITLNTKSNLGMAPVLSGMFCLSQVFNWNFSTLTLIYYIALVAAQFAIRGKNYRLYDLLQVPMSLAFSSFIGVFSALITVDPQALWQKLLVLAAAVIVTGVGITMVVNMRMVPNPGDGIVNAISEVSGMSLGTSKNVFDGGSAAVTIVLSLILTGRIIGVGIGTVINVLCVGRVVAAFSWLCKDKMLRLAFGTGENTEAAA
jgi:uncharacterized membrane protein YczE